MKKSILIIGAVLISSSIYAQTDTVKINKMPSDELPKAKQMQGVSNGVNDNQPDIHDSVQIQNVKQKLQNGVFMEGGKMMMVAKGVVAALNRELKMANGTLVYSNGTYVLLNGTRFFFRNGDEMDMHGNLTQLK